MQQPNSLHQDFLRHDLLRVYQHRWAMFFFLIIFSGIAFLAFLGLDAPRVLWRLYTTKEVTVEALLAISGMGVFLLFVVTGTLSLRRQSPRHFQVQNFVFWPRILINWLAGIVVLLLGIMAMLALYVFVITNVADNAVTEAAKKENRKTLVFGIGGMFLVFLLAGLGALWLLRRGTNYLMTYWRHVRLTGYFDREHYRLGDQVKFSIKDRQSLGGQQAYRVHLNYVKERMSGEGKKQQLVRKVVWSTYQDTTSGALHTGIQVALPSNENVRDYITDFSFPLPISYWELLIEGEKPHFFARYFLQVGFNPTLTNGNV